MAVAVEGKPVVGAITSGSSGERWWAAEGLGAFKGGKAISVSSDRPLADAWVGTGDAARDARVARIYAGTSEVMKVIIAKSLGLCLARSSRPRQLATSVATRPDSSTLQRV